MGFRLPGKSVTSGTSGHTSALKMKQMEVNEAAIAAAKAEQAKNAAAKMRTQQHEMPDGSQMDGAEHVEGKSPAKNPGRALVQVFSQGGKLIKHVAPKIKSTKEVIKKIPKAIPEVTSKLKTAWNTTKKYGKYALLGIGGVQLGRMMSGASDNADDNAANTTTPPKTTKKKKSNGSYSRAKKNDPNLESYIAGRKKHAKGSDEYNAFQNKINKAYGSKTRHGVTTSSSTKGRKTTSTKNTPGIGSLNKMTKTQRDGDVKKLKTSWTDDRGTTTKNTRTKRGVFSDKVRSKKYVAVTKGAAGSDLADKRTKQKTKYTRDGEVKRSKKVVTQDGRRTVTKTNRRGKTTTKTKKTINPFD